MKKILIMICMFLMVFTVSTFAANDVKVLFNDGYMDFTDENGNVVNPELTNSRTMVPLRKIFEAIGAEIEWDNDTRTVTATKGDKTVVLTIGSEEAYIMMNNGIDAVQKVILDSPAYIVEGRTLIPLRFVSESFDCLVGWDNDTRTAIIVNPETIAKYGIDQFVLKCGNIIKFASMVKSSDDYKVTDLRIKLEGIEDQIFSNDINLKVINNKEKLYLNFLTNPFSPELSEETAEQVSKVFFEMDLSQVENNVTNITSEEIIEAVVNSMNQEDIEVTLTTYEETKHAIDVMIMLLSQGNVNEHGISWKISYSQLAQYMDLTTNKGEINLIILLDDNGYIKTVDFKIEAEENGVVSSIFIGTETNYSKTAYKLPADAQMDSVENLIFTVLMLIMTYMPAI